MKFIQIKQKLYQIKRHNGTKAQGRKGIIKYVWFTVEPLNHCAIKPFFLSASIRHGWV
jgi:hypothetical protein